MYRAGQTSTCSLYHSLLGLLRLRPLDLSYSHHQRLTNESADEDSFMHSSRVWVLVNLPASLNTSTRAHFSIATVFAL